MEGAARADDGPAPNGHVTAGFERVLELFEHETAASRGGAALCVYADGQPVVDVWAGEAAPDVPWARDTTSTLFSCSKGMTALCAQILAFRGALDVEAPVGRYWPEFAQGGKERALVRHVLSHSVGVVALPDAGDLLDWDGRGWDDYDAIAARLARAPLAWEPGTRVGYHAVTSGWMTAELVRRVDGRTLGAFFREEVAEPLGLDLWIGTPPDQQPRLARLHPFPETPPTADEAYVAAVEREHLARPETLLAQSLIHMHGATIVADPVAFFSNPRVRAAEIPASNGSGTAHGLARMYAMLAMGGELDGTRIVSPASIARFATEAATGPSAVWPWRELRLPSGKLARAPIARWALGYALDVPSPEEPAPVRTGRRGVRHGRARRPGRLLRPAQPHRGRLRAQRPALGLRRRRPAGRRALRLRRARRRGVRPAAARAGAQPRVRSWCARRDCSDHSSMKPGEAVWENRPPDSANDASDAS